MMRTRRIASLLALPLLALSMARDLDAAPDRGPGRLDTSELEALAAAERAALAGREGPPLPFGPPPNPQVGDSWMWYVWSLGGFPDATLESCTVRGSNADVYVVVRDADWNVYVTQADVDAILQHMESVSYGIFPNRGIYEMDVETFGTPPLGLDADPKIYLLYHDLDISSDGFVANWSDPYPDQGTGLNKSNECEVVYLNCGPDPGVDHSPSGNYMLAVAAHEMEHLIHNGYDQNEENWLDESLAEIGMYLFDPTVEYIAGFLSNPDISITIDGLGGSYGARYFFGTHLYEEYGGPTTTREIITTAADGITGLNQALAQQGYSETFEDVFRSWVAANYLDDPRIAGGLYGYDFFDYPPIAEARSILSYPAGPFTGSVSPWAADYIRYSNFAPSGLEVTFDGSNADNYAVQVLMIDSTDSVLPQVVPMTLDGSRAGSVVVPANSGYDTAVLVAAATSPAADPSTYTFGAQIVAPIVLKVTKGDDPVREAQLTWTTPSSPPFRVLRGDDAATLEANPPDTFPVIVKDYLDVDSPYPLTFYLVVR